MNADAREHLYESVGKSLLVGRVGEAWRDRARLSSLMQEDTARADRGVRWWSGTRLGALPVMNNFQVRVGLTADTPRV